MKKIFTVGTCLLVVSALAIPAAADDYPGSAGTVSLELDSGPIGPVITVDGQGVYSCPYTYTLTNINPAGLFGNDVTTLTQSGFCISLTKEITTETYDNFGVYATNNPITAIGPLSQPQSSEVEQLMYQYQALGDGTNKGNLLDPFNVHVDQDLNTALSIAIWDALTATGPALAINTAGNISASGTNTKVIPDADAWLAGLGPATATAAAAWFSSNNYTLVSFDGTSAYQDGNPSNKDIQSQSIVLMGVTTLTGGSNPATPEPKDAKSLAGLGLLGLAAGLVVAFRRRGGIALPRNG